MKANKFLLWSIAVMAFIWWVVLPSVENVLSQQTQTPAQQIQQLRNEIAKRDVIIEDTKAERNALILRAAELTKNAIAINDGISKATNLLQKGYNDGKLNYEELRLMGFNIVVDSTNVYQRPTGNSRK